MGPISTKYRSAEIIFEVRNPSAGTYYAEGSIYMKNERTLQVRSGDCASFEDARTKLLQNAYVLVDEVFSG